MSNDEMRPGGAAAEPVDRPDFESVYEHNFDFVWRSVAYRGVPAALMDDVVQEVFLVVHRKLPEFEGRSTLRTWLTGIIRKVARDQLRKKSHLPSGDELDVETQSAAPSPVEVLERRRAADTLEEILERMSEDQREAFVLLEIEGMSGKEIAEAVGVPENTVWSRVRAARGIFNAGLARLKAAHVWRDRD
jgi:RNA polymerase sigma-70 factor (ECF subfamily)